MGYAMEKRSTSVARAVRISAGLALALGLTFAPWSNVWADQGGVAFWLSGQYASLAALPATPGWSVAVIPYYFNGSASSSRTFQIGATAVSGLKSNAPSLLAVPSYAPETKILGGQLSLALAVGVGRNNSAVDLTLSPTNVGRNTSDSISGGTDLYPTTSLAWNSGNHNWMAYLTGDIPTGAYDKNRLANLGIGHGAIDAGGGYTYFDQQSGREVSAVVGLTYNFENHDAQYKNGIDSHLDWAASQFLSASWHMGVAGYVYYQLTGDTGSGNRVGSFKSRVAAVGPQVGYIFKIMRNQGYVNMRAYKEFWAKNRVEGYMLFATLSISFGTAKK